MSNHETKIEDIENISTVQEQKENNNLETLTLMKRMEKFERNMKEMRECVHALTREFEKFRITSQKENLELNTSYMKNEILVPLFLSSIQSKDELIKGLEKDANELKAKFEAEIKDLKVKLAAKGKHGGVGKV